MFRSTETTFKAFHTIGEFLTRGPDFITQRISLICTINMTRKLKYSNFML
jgi:hypothetical protein